MSTDLMLIAEPGLPPKMRGRPGREKDEKEENMVVGFLLITEAETRVVSSKTKQKLLGERTIAF